MPAARQNRSKLADTSSQALPTAPRSVGGKAIDVVLTLFMALLSFRGISTPSLPAQGGQRRFSYFNIQRGNPSVSPSTTRAGFGRQPEAATLRPKDGECLHRLQLLAKALEGELRFVRERLRAD